MIFSHDDRNLPFYKRFYLLNSVPKMALSPTSTSSNCTPPRAKIRRLPVHRTGCIHLLYHYIVTIIQYVSFRLNLLINGFLDIEKYKNGVLTNIFTLYFFLISLQLGFNLSQKCVSNLSARAESIKSSLTLTKEAQRRAKIEFDFKSDNVRQVKLIFHTFY